MTDTKVDIVETAEIEVTQAPAAEAVETESAPEVTQSPVVEESVAETEVAKEPSQEESVAEPAEQSAIETAIAQAKASSSTTMASLGTIFANYRATMGNSKGTDMTVIVEQNMQLWAGMRAMVNDPHVFRDAMRFTMAVFGDNADGAFELRLLLRGIDVVNTRLNEDHRRAYIGLMTLLSTAAGMNNPKTVGKVVDVSKALESTVFSNEARQRVTGFFAS